MPAEELAPAETISSSEPPPISAENIERVEQVGGLIVGERQVYSLAFSPDGRYLAVGTASPTIQIWDVTTGELFVELEGHTSRVTEVLFSPDGSLLASGSWDKTVIVWQTEDWAPLYTIQDHENYIGAIAFSPDGALLASGGTSVIVVDAETGEQVYELSSSSIIAHDIFFSHDGTQLYAAHGEVNVAIWDLETGQLDGSVSGDAVTTYLAYSPGGILAGGSWSFEHESEEPLGRIVLWDMRTGERVGATEEKTIVLDMLFSVDDSLLISTVWGGVDVLFWRTADGTLLRTIRDHASPSYAMALTQDGTLLATGDTTGHVLLWAVPQE